MDCNRSESLKTLENLMEEFFDVSTSNLRKHEIEHQLNSFKSVPEFWKLCLYFLTNTNNQYVTMFALSTLEFVITYHWENTEWSFHEELKNTLYNYLILKGNQAPHFLRGKYAKLLVTIAKLDWPHNYANFMLNIIELLKSDQHQVIGLTLLKTTSEEFMNSNASFSTTRKGEIDRLLNDHIPTIFDSLNNILIKLNTKLNHKSTATPPPSPTNLIAVPCLSPQLVTEAFKFDSRVFNKEILETIQHLFTWVDIKTIPSTVIKSIFDLTQISSYAQDDHDICVQAISTVNEILYRKCTPPGSQDFFNKIYYLTVELLRDTTISPSDSLDAIFVEKLCELLVLLVDQHFWHLENDSYCPALNFFNLLYEFTIQLPAGSTYVKCLKVWEALIKPIKLQKNSKYLHAFLNLLTNILTKIQFSRNANELLEIDNSDFNDDHETDWEVFLKTSLDVVSMIGECAPLETLNAIMNAWTTCYDVYRRLETITNQQTCSLNCDSSESQRLYYFVTDFSSLTQALAVLSPIFCNMENSDSTIISSPMISSITEKLLESASLATTLKFYTLQTNNAKLTEAFIENHSQLFVSLRTFLIWITRTNKIGIENLQIITDVVLPMFQSTVPNKIRNSAAQLFLAVCGLSCATNLIMLASVLQLISAAPNLKMKDDQTTLIIYSAITCLLLKPWPDSSDENSNHRDMITRVFFDTLTWDFRSLTSSDNEGRVKQVLGEIIPLITHIVKFSKDFPIASKKKLFISIKSSVEHAITLFPIFANNADISTFILTFVLSVLQVLQQQLETQEVKNAVQVFLDVAIREQEAGFFLDKLLNIFQLVIEAPGASYKNFLPGILQLCMDNVYPYILTRGTEHIDAFLALLSLLHSILLHRWQYFCSSQVRLGYSPVYGETESEAPEPVQLIAVLQVFGQALLHEDINIFRQSLFCLEDLNSKWKLYHNILFRYNIMSKYLIVLIQTLVDKSQNLFSEDIQVAIYNMAAVNLDSFFARILPEFLKGIPNITDQQKELLLQSFIQNHDKDMPTFIGYLRIFIKDIQYFILARHCS